MSEMNNKFDATESAPLGYKTNSAGTIEIHPEEADAVRYIFDKFNEYTDNPPRDLVEAVLQDHPGEDMSYDEAKNKVPLDRINERVLREVIDRWPGIEVRLPRNIQSYQLNASCTKGFDATADQKLEPIISEEDFAAVQEALKGRNSEDASHKAMDDTVQGINGLTM